MLSQEPRQGCVVVGIDGSGTSDNALEWAVAEATSAGAPLHLVHALPWMDAGPAPTPEPWDPVVTRMMESLGSRAHALDVTAETVTGSAAGALVRASEHALLVVIGSDGTSAWPAAVLGSVTQQVPMHARCPVVVVPPPRVFTVGHRGDVVVGMDEATASFEALRFALHRAHRDGSRVIAVHCSRWRDGDPRAGEVAAIRHEVFEEERESVHHLIASARRELPEVPVDEHYLTGHPVPSLEEASLEASLLVVGTRGRGGFSGLLLGSVAQRLLAQPRCPVVVVRP